jgi:hypothetical protein
LLQGMHDRHTQMVNIMLSIILLLQILLLSIFCVFLQDFEMVRLQLGCMEIIYFIKLVLQVSDFLMELEPALEEPLGEDLLLTAD